ncbi:MULTISPECIES: cytochrome o ubiquinol oxidase subunit IV [Commensalibacter]|uniref:Cytochrome bo(3) ubiquinol oxidase subunit 4 n=2 Tax=Commensalibacter TaxID=1079922 RepID=W7DNY7_9PROT|nr:MULTISPECIES: cytochrome o ubiquinol oxidase subunit IV [Commensalibacter]EUK19012.1 ubiquinol oxidase subunit IV [Commensalibacter papalotli (ex Servin-Garciduenas et al. 2014)]CAI3924136.1 Heme/copper-type cytochrome/quinol oxidase [Commensalibacter papalotli (ex Botero et al. 2024)]CAI3927913.1 Heme/copper-type cytochrome/quinol oxidase [Commensalibacter papalotli (ex Botero et al. 2024)]
MVENHAVSSHGEDHGHGSIVSYIVGFILSVVLTVASFWIVLAHALSNSATVIALGVLAVIQIFVQVSFFLHVSAAPEQRSEVVSFLFSVFVALVICFGTLFVMHNVGHLMMAR